MGSKADTTHDTSFAPLPHDRSQFTYASSYTEFSRHAGHPYTGNASYMDPASQSYVSVPGIKIVEDEDDVQMFPSKPKAAMAWSVCLTFLCCFVCSIPAVVLSKQAMDYQKEGEKRLAARLANQIAFWLILSVMCGVLCWAATFILMYGFRR